MGEINNRDLFSVVCFCYYGSMLFALQGRLEQQFGPASAAAIFKAFSIKRLPTLRANTLKITDAQMMEHFRAQHIMFERVKGIPHASIIKNKTSAELLETDFIKNGEGYLQGLTSMLPALILDAQPGETILDLCAAPGSKTSQIAALIKNTGHIVACEKDFVRVQKLQHTLNLQGITNTEIIEGDATLVLTRLTPDTRFDRILADVPCSAEGRIDLKNLRSYSFWSEKNIIAHAKEQRRLLRAAMSALKPGGTLVYSTCTLAPEENEQMIAWLCTEYPQLKEVPITLPIANKKLSHGVVILPSSQHEGFFVCKLKI
jgi:16S rRNA (cytosine1407-C5)-methyltransferase